MTTKMRSTSRWPQTASAVRSWAAFWVMFGAGLKWEKGRGRSSRSLGLCKQGQHTHSWARKAMSALAGPSTVVSSGRRMLLASSLCKCLLQRPTSAAVATFARSRAIHTRPTLPYDINAGVEPFLSARALRGTAVEWHQGNLDRLNDLVRGVCTSRPGEVGQIS